MGLDLGLEQAGLSIELAVELDKWCCETIRENQRNLLLIDKDVRGLTGKEIRTKSGFDGEVFLIAGGPPCQSFSSGGKRASLADPRGNLVFEFFRIVDEVRPRHFLFENVANLVTAAVNHRPIAKRPGQHWNLSMYERGSVTADDADPMTDDELSGSAIRLLLEELPRLRYKISFKVVDAASYGAPQHRLRFVMLGSRDSGPPRFPIATHGPKGSGLAPWGTLRDAIYDLRSCPGPSSEYTEPVRRIFEQIPEGGNWRSLPPNLQRLALGSSLEAGGGKTGFFRRLSWDRPAPTITGRSNRKASALCHPEFVRPLSVKECARIQGFPDDWRLSGSMAQQYQQVGNAVPVHLGRAFGRALNEKNTANDDSRDFSLMLKTAVKRLRAAGRNTRSTSSEQLILGKES